MLSFMQNFGKLSPSSNPHLHNWLANVVGGVIKNNNSMCWAFESHLILTTTVWAKYYDFYVVDEEGKT